MTEKMNETGKTADWAVITGASSGIGYEFARRLYSEGYSLILCARRAERLEKLRTSLINHKKDQPGADNQDIITVPADLADAAGRDELKSTLENIRTPHSDQPFTPVTVCINCAGFGLAGQFIETDVDKELSMIDINVTALHDLTKYFLRMMTEEINQLYAAEELSKHNSSVDSDQSQISDQHQVSDQYQISEQPQISENAYKSCKDIKSRFKILNVASSAGLFPGGPFMSTYYATKAYVTSLTLGISEELRESGNPIYIGALCPGPVDTEFNQVAEVKFALKGITPERCVDDAIKGMNRNKTIIIPTAALTIACFFAKILPRRLMLKLAAHQQKKKIYR